MFSKNLILVILISNTIVYAMEITQEVNNENLQNFKENFKIEILDVNNNLIIRSGSLEIQAHILSDAAQIAIRAYTINQKNETMRPRKLSFQSTTRRVKNYALINIPKFFIIYEITNKEQFFKEILIQIYYYYLK
jgi:hypothetical protein